MIARYQASIRHDMLRRYNHQRGELKHAGRWHLRTDFGQPWPTTFPCVPSQCFFEKSLFLRTFLHVSLPIFPSPQTSFPVSTKEKPLIMMLPLFCWTAGVICAVLVSHVGQEVQFCYCLNRITSPTYLLYPIHGLQLTVIRMPPEFLSTWLSVCHSSFKTKFVQFNANSCQQIIPPRLIISAAPPALQRACWLLLPRLNVLLALLISIAVCSCVITFPFLNVRRAFH